MRKKRPILQDMIDRVGVTKMTVSRLLHNPEQVPVALRGKTAAAFDELGYIPNRTSDILSSATSRVIGVLLPPLTNQVFVKVLRGIEGVTDAHGYQTVLVHYGYKLEVEQECLESMLSWNIDGLILIERAHTPRTLKMIGVTGIPMAELMDSQSPCLDIVVGFDNSEVTHQMITTIIARGHHHITYLGARLDERTIIRQKGYEQAILDAGLVPCSVMVEQSSSYSSDTELIHQAWRGYPQLDGVFCIDDDPAVGTAFECQRLGLKVSSGVVIIGFHGHDIGQVMGPRLTNVLAPRERVDSIGAGRLLVHIRGESVTLKVLDLGFTLSPDGST